MKHANNCFKLDNDGVHVTKLFPGCRTLRVRTERRGGKFTGGAKLANHSNVGIHGELGFGPEKVFPSGVLGATFGIEKARTLGERGIAHGGLLV